MSERLINLADAEMGSGVPVRQLRRWIQLGLVRATPESQTRTFRGKPGRPSLMVDLDEVIRVRDKRLRNRFRDRLTNGQ